MPILKTRSVFQGITAKEAMQRQIVRLPSGSTIRQCIRYIIKFKTNSVLATDPEDQPAGVVTKTDIITAFYAGFDIDMPISDIMVGSPYFCHEGDPLETAIDQMQTLGIHQLFVQSDINEEIEGQMTYSDIVGLLYRYCRHCVKSGRCSKLFTKNEIPRLIVEDVMTRTLIACNANQTITEIIEILLERKKSAILVMDKSDSSSGIISKTDILFAFIRGTRPDTPAKAIMNSPVITCGFSIQLSEAIQQMLLYDIHRIFVADEKNRQIIGVLSLSDATRFRSGTCKACGAGRILDIPAS